MPLVWIHWFWDTTIDPNPSLTPLKPLGKIKQTHLISVRCCVFVPLSPPNKNPLVFPPNSINLSTTEPLSRHQSRHHEWSCINFLLYKHFFLDFSSHVGETTRGIKGIRGSWRRNASRNPPTSRSLDRNVRSNLCSVPVLCRPFLKDTGYQCLAKKQHECLDIKLQYVYMLGCVTACRCFLNYHTKVARLWSDMMNLRGFAFSFSHIFTKSESTWCFYLA